VEITEVRVTLMNEEKLKAYASMTFDGCFVVRGLKVISGSEGYFVSMPSRRRRDGTYQDLAHPITEEMRKYIVSTVLGSFEAERGRIGHDGGSQAVETAAESRFAGESVVGAS
jgi:stage V sporulation protein G